MALAKILNAEKQPRGSKERRAKRNNALHFLNKLLKNFNKNVNMNNYRKVYKSISTIPL
jgi:hypothetical protein